MPTFSKFIDSQRGGKLLVDTDGYLYSRKHANKDYVVYLCRRNTRSKKVVEQILQLPCPAKLHFYEDERLFLGVLHNHEPQVAEAEWSSSSLLVLVQGDVRRHSRSRIVGCRLKKLIGKLIDNMYVVRLYLYGTWS